MNTAGIDETVLREPVCDSFPFPVNMSNAHQPLLAQLPANNREERRMGMHRINSRANQLSGKLRVRHDPKCPTT
ncbi:unnamed protein product [Linum trigynum]|uniref:Uncharacterized protein n=1 Tax=Linum trigynum TaxID=586398 RepID=A0AAV2CEV0_9ROSI